jgi:hypothetical protein
MADDKTNRRISLHANVKTWLPPTLFAGLGLLWEVVHGWSPVEIVKGWLEEPAKAGLPIDTTGPLAAKLLKIFAAPATGFGFGMWAAKLEPVRAMLDGLLPDPPYFARSDTKLERLRTMVLLEKKNGEASDFVGRDVEKADLVEFARVPGDRFLWRAVTGPSGIGKSRLAVEWLDAMSREGWDVGVVDRWTNPMVRKWRARRRTALVIDEAGRLWGADLGRAVAALYDGSRSNAPVRLLIIDQIEPAADRIVDPEIRQRVRDARYDETLALRGLGNEAVAALWREDGAHELNLSRVQAETGGRPRAVILLARGDDRVSYAEALADWAVSLLPELTDSPGDAVDHSDIGVLKALSLSALAGPMSIKAAAAACGATFDAHRLTRFFPFDDLAAALPAFEPEDLGQEILLRTLAYLPSEDLAELTRVAINANVDVMERTLNSLWRDRAEVGYAIGVISGLAPSDQDAAAKRSSALAAVQIAFDKAYPELGTAAAEAAKALALEMADEFRLELETKLLDSVAKRPFDAAVRVSEAKGAVNALGAYGEARRFEDLERWGARLIALAEIKPFANDPAIRICEAYGATNAINSYGETERFEDLERWGARLLALVETRPFADDPAVRLAEARSAVNAIKAYGKAWRFEDLERWGARLIVLAETKPFAEDPTIRLEEAKGAFNAISYYGEVQRFGDLERWGARLIALAETTPFTDDPAIRLREGSGAVNAIAHYGAARRFKDLERWGARLLALAETSPFAADPAIRLHEAMGAVNAIAHYGAAHRFKDLERWGASLIALAETTLFADDPGIRLHEAKGVGNAISDYGKAGLFEDMERWGARLIVLAEVTPFTDDPAIRLQEAQGAFNAITRYGEVGRLEHMERWGTRLIALAETTLFAADPAIALQITLSAGNAIIFLGKVGAAGFNQRAEWFSVLAKCARRFPTEDPIQARAGEYNLSFVHQEARGWPYGRS